MNQRFLVPTVAVTAVAVAAYCLTSPGRALQSKNVSTLRVGEKTDAGGTLVSSNQTVTPVGTVMTVERSRPKDLALSPDKQTVAVLSQSRVLLYGATGGKLVADVAIGAAAPLGIAWSPDGKTVWASLAGGKVARLAPDATGAWAKAGEIVVDVVAPDGAPDVAAGVAGQGRAKGDPQVNGLAVSPDGKMLYAALGIRNAVAVIDLAQNKVIRSVAVDVSPYHVALAADGATLAVACRGGKAAAKNEASAPSAGTDVRVDTETDAAKSGSVALLRTDTLAVSTVPVGRQPGGMAFAPDGKTLYVASENDDAVYAMSVENRRVSKTYSVENSTDPGFGQMPNSIAVSDSGETLYVACGGANAVAVVSAKSGKITGYIPAGWYPIAVAQTGGNLVIASSKGFGGRVAGARSANAAAAAIPAYNVHSSLGVVQFVPVAAYSNLPALTRTVGQNNRWLAKGAGGDKPRKNTAPVPLPERVGEPSVFEYVVYIIKENHTYDDDFGDMKEGNGDPSLCLFGEAVTPNAHALAREFVLLDNTYTSGTNSADGHQWSVSGVANGYLEHNYSAHARSYPYDGGDPLAYSPRGFLWTSAVRAKKTVRVYGEFVNKPKIVDKATGKSGAKWAELWADYKNKTGKYAITSDTDNAALKPYLHPRYIGFPSTVSDQWRADQFLVDVDGFEKSGTMPNLSILLLPNDHTSGTRPDSPTPRATTADGDLALGRIVDRLSHSRFWKKTLILVIEDDSQMGLDHVDGHRTVALCVSPYTRRNTVVSDTYNHTSLLRTIGLVLGLAPMNRFDRTATPMRACFTPTPNFAPFVVRPNTVPLDEMNPPASALNGEAKAHAVASAKLDLSDVDRADMGVLSRAVWHAQKPGVPFPSARYKPGADGDDD